jgi:hypothetical protein
MVENEDWMRSDEGSSKPQGNHSPISFVTFIGINVRGTLLKTNALVNRRFGPGGIYSGQACAVEKAASVSKGEDCYAEVPDRSVFGGG